MFAQVIQGRTSDAEGLRAAMDRWVQELAPGSIGWLGSTGGVTDDGGVFMAARFESEEAARRNSAREEQGTWWAETEKFLENATFQDSAEVQTLGGGGSNDAGFVQVMRGRITDKEKAPKLMARFAELLPVMAERRPDIIGDVTVIHSDGTYSDILYFTSEADAREGEKKEMPAEMQSMFEEYMAAMPIDEYIDLKDPWLL
jgi:hypothetical protein